MWTFTAYILFKLCESRGRGTLAFSELHTFMFDVLWKKYKIVLNDSSVELKKEVEYLSELGAVEFDGHTIKINKDRLKKIAMVVEHSQLRDQLLLYREYLSRINQAIQEVRDNEDTPL